MINSILVGHSRYAPAKRAEWQAFSDVDRSGNLQHRLASNLVYSVARFVTKGTKLRARSERPSLPGRSFSLVVSEVDRTEPEPGANGPCRLNSWIMRAGMWQVLIANTQSP